MKPLLCKWCEGEERGDRSKIWRRKVRREIPTVTGDRRGQDVSEPLTFSPTPHGQEDIHYLPMLKDVASPHELLQVTNDVDLALDTNSIC